MKRFNLHDMYEAGRWLGRISDLQASDNVLFRAYDLWMARLSLTGLLATGSVLLNASRRAGEPVLAAINDIIPVEWKEGQITNDTVVGERHAQALSSRINEFHTVLKSEMPDVAAYVVAQKGIYRTEDLISEAQKAIATSLVGLLPPQAVTDLKEAGKCLAFELGTACAFHLWRAVESVIGLYYAQFSGKTFEQAKVKNRNWGQYIKALEDVGADSKVTMMLRHIKDEFRNPQTHPEESVKVEEAKRLFGVAVSTIEQMLQDGYQAICARSNQAGDIIPPPPLYDLTHSGHMVSSVGGLLGAVALGSVTGKPPKGVKLTAKAPEESDSP